jgi:hypothetical protein
VPHFWPVLPEVGILILIGRFELMSEDFILGPVIPIQAKRRGGICFQPEAARMPTEPWKNGLSAPRHDIPRNRALVKYRAQPRSGERMQPTARAVGNHQKQNQPPQGRKKLLPNVSLVILNSIFL